MCSSYSSPPVGDGLLDVLKRVQNLWMRGVEDAAPYNTHKNLSR